MPCSDVVSFKRDTTLLIKRVSSIMLNSHRRNVYITIRVWMLLSINKRGNANSVFQVQIWQSDAIG